MERATHMRAPHVDGIAPLMLSAIARLFCAAFGGHEDIRKFDPQAGRLYLQCIRCLRTTRGYSVKSAPHVAHLTNAADAPTTALARSWA